MAQASITVQIGTGRRVDLNGEIADDIAHEMVRRVADLLIDPVPPQPAPNEEAPAQD